jgi:hypothetical protein
MHAIAQPAFLHPRLLLCQRGQEALSWLSPGPQRYRDAISKVLTRIAERLIFSDGLIKLVICGENQQGLECTQAHLFGKAYLVPPPRRRPLGLTRRAHSRRTQRYTDPLARLCGTHPWPSNWILPPQKKPYPHNQQASGRQETLTWSQGMPGVRCTSGNHLIQALGFPAARRFIRGTVSTGRH